MQSKLPFHADPDYRDAMIFAIRSRLGCVAIDTSAFEVYGYMDVDCSGMEALSSIPVIGSARRTYDRGIVYSDPAIPVL